MKTAPDWERFLCNGIKESADVAFFTLVGARAFVFFDKAAAFHHFDGCDVIRKADAFHTVNTKLRHNHRQE